ncbi:Cell wall protein qid3 [Cladobotryum mycophilum]|uniref:Cell wall protein qid3 n=1 Tax=Cladobotryum mycophilum TaxID=491253 RepID=A0ABR0T4U3_9HYPO
MKFFAVATLFAAAVMASPVEIRTWPDFTGCLSGLFNNPKCCATDILGIADLDCYVPTVSYHDARGFQAVCAAGGQRARCCVLDAVDQGVLCTSPVGVI